MDVMSPDLLWIGDRCYRLPLLNSTAGESNLVLEKNEYTESDAMFDCYERNCEDEDDEEHLIETLPNNRYKLNLSVPQTFWSKIIGAKGVTRKRIESDTNTTVIIPRPMEHGNVVIKGLSKRNVILAKKMIESIVYSSRQKLVFTHFISIPTNCEEIKKNFFIFKAALVTNDVFEPAQQMCFQKNLDINYLLYRQQMEEVLKLFGKDRGVDESIFQNPEKLHATIGTLVLTDQNERHLAEKLLAEVFEKSVRPLIINQKSLIIKMQGTEYMNDDPAEVDVLYAKVASVGSEDVIQKIADNILKYFSQHKLMKSNEKEEVKLHVTLMNTLFREEDPDELDMEAEGVSRNKWGKKTRRTFNAVNILQHFHDFYFGQQEVKNIQLSVRFSTAKDGYYKSSCILNI